ncbi:MAG: hypothetical protein AB7N76_12035 [Planctomycetota bacterium]
MHKLALALTLMALVAAPVRADEAAMAQKLGDAYTGAKTPSDKMVVISEAIADKKIQSSPDRRAAQAAVDAIYVAELTKGKSSKERLELLGALRKQTEQAIKDLNKARRDKDKKAAWASFMEPDSNIQQALIVSYVFDTAGPTPSVDKLACLKLVRECTSWFGNGTLVAGYLAEALARDEAYGKADHEGKLEIIRKLAVDGQTMSDHERKTLETPVVCDWISVQIKAGKSPADVLAGVQDLGKRQKLCFFTRSWAESLLKQLPSVR